MGLGDFLGNVLGSKNDFRVNDPYQSDVLAQALGRTSSVYDNQDMLAKALMAQSQGQGPNPALMQLRQTTDQNNQNAASLMASQRGMNPAAAASMAAQIGANNNQQASGQAATMQAHQQLAAQGQAANLYSQMGNQQLNQQGLINSANNAANQINSGVAAQNTQAGNAIIGGLLNAGGAMGASALGAPAKPAAPAALAHGGKVPGQANVPGDSTANDTVDAKLSPGEIVVPRSKAGSPEMAKEFIDHLMKTKRSKESGGFGKVLEAHRKLSDALKSLEKKAA